MYFKHIQLNQVFTAVLLGGPSYGMVLILGSSTLSVRKQEHFISARKLSSTTSILEKKKIPCSRLKGEKPKEIRKKTVPYGKVQHVSQRWRKGYYSYIYFIISFLFIYLFSYFIIFMNGRRGAYFFQSLISKLLKSLVMHQNLFGTKLVLNCIDSVEFQKCRTQCTDTRYHWVNNTGAFRKCSI